MANSRKNNTAQASKQETVTPSVIEKQEKITAKDIDQNQYVVVRNGFQGTLVYTARTGETYIWDSFGSEQEIELRELKNAKSSHKKMFENNWFMFDEPWIIDYLGVGQYYRNAISIDNFDDMFKKSPDDLKDLIAGMSDGQKKSVAYRARQLINDGTIDSRKTITALEEALNTELIEK
mgnify:CR=1 FL=1